VGHAELGLASGPAQEHDQVPRDPKRGVPAEVVLDQGEREVDPGGDARRGEEGRGSGRGAVPHEDRVGVDGQVRIFGGERVAVRPVRRYGAGVQQAGFG
jgi:hypothetical protein